MFFYGKRTGYLALYEGDEKIRTVGFVQVCGASNHVQISIRIKNGGEEWNGNYPVRLLGYSERINMGDIRLCMGNGFWERNIKVKDDMLATGSVTLPSEKMKSVQIQLTEKENIWGAFCRNVSGETCREIQEGEQTRRESEQDRQKEPQGESEENYQTESGELKETEYEEGKERLQGPEIVVQEQFCDDKWEQLLRQYKNVHPFGDDRIFVAIEPKDFIILSEPYQKLVHNSFLLHGFYNYRHLILGKDGRIGNDTETCFYLGVPGVFFEREKQVAIMFGFEGFECAGAVDVGKFGYYMRTVTI